MRHLFTFIWRNTLELVANLIHFAVNSTDQISKVLTPHLLRNRSSEMHVLLSLAANTDSLYQSFFTKSSILFELDSLFIINTRRVFIVPGCFQFFGLGNSTYENFGDLLFNSFLNYYNFCSSTYAGLDTVHQNKNEMDAVLHSTKRA